MADIEREMLHHILAMWQEETLMADIAGEEFTGGDVGGRHLWKTLLGRHCAEFWPCPGGDISGRHCRGISREE